MKSLVRILGRTSFGIFLRNFLNYKPVHMSVNGLKLISVSDAFAWRTDNNFKTIFKYSDILNVFYKIKNSWIEFHFYDKNNNLLKIQKKENLNLSNEMQITDNFFKGLKDYGVFYVYHLSKEKIDNENIISNRCYIGYAQNQNLPSFVHGNTLARFTEISGNKKVYSDIVKTSLFPNHLYKIQKYFNNFDKNELFFSNPTSKTIKFSIDDKKFKLKNGCSLIIDISDKKVITIKSNCLFLRPTVFSYKDEYLDVHHS
jgi:hypothetical protein